jgi:AraC-like DNA-binding protein
MIKHFAFENHIYDFLEEAGIDANEIRSRLHLHASSRHERLEMLANYAMDQSNEDLLGLIIGQRVTNTSYGLLGHALINSTNLLASYRFLLKHLWIWQEESRNAVSLHIDKDYVYLSYNTPPNWPRNSHFLVELFFSSNLKRSRELLAGNMKGAYLQLKREAPIDDKRFRKLLNVRVEFGQIVDRMVIPLKVAEAPLSFSSLVHSRAYQRHCERLLLDMKTTSKLVGKIRLAVVHNGRTKLKETQMASKLKISVRTLRRRLKAEGTSYRDIKIQMQLDLAQSYLSDTELSVADIANLVNYFDTATFSRAFKLKTGSTPPQFRRAHHAKSWAMPC